MMERTICRACVVVVGQVVGHAGRSRVDVAAAEVLGRDHLAGRRLHQRRAAEEDRALISHDDRLVAHRRDVGAAGGARPHDRGDLRDARGRHPGLVEEDAAEVLLVGEDLVLHRQEGAAGVDEVDAGQPVLLGDGLGAQVLLHRDRVVGAALHRGVVGDDHALAAGDLADAGDDAGARRVVVVHPVGRQRRRSRGTASPGRAAWSTRSRGSSLPRDTCRSRDVSGAALTHLGEPRPQLATTSSAPDAG